LRVGRPDRLKGMTMRPPVSGPWTRWRGSARWYRKTIGYPFNYRKVYVE
jgi:hypothetical protein